MKPDVLMLRFFTRVFKTPTCWIWTGSISPGGYGRFYTKDKMWTAHRWLYEQLYGSIEYKMELDHLCRNRACINPKHLEPVTHRENAIRGETGRISGDRNLAKTHCKQGHEFSLENTDYYKNKPGRRCRICHRIRETVRRANKQLKGE